MSGNLSRATIDQRRGGGGAVASISLPGATARPNRAWGSEKRSLLLDKFSQV